MATQTLEIRLSSASLHGQRSGMRELPDVAKYIYKSGC